MKIVFVFVFFYSLLFSNTINNSLLKIHSNIMPKVLLLEKNIEQKLKNNTINITLVYEKNNYKDMKYLTQEIRREYPNGISGYNIKIVQQEYGLINKCDPNIDILYIFPSSKDNIKNLIQIYSRCKAITFASNKEYLKEGAMISIDVGKTVKPIVNLVAVKNSGITFKPVLLSISKVYNYEE